MNEDGVQRSLNGSSDTTFRCNTTAGMKTIISTLNSSSEINRRRWNAK